MARLAPRAAELVRALSQRTAISEWLFGPRLDLAVLSELEGLDEAAIAPLLLPFVLDGERDTRDRVAGMVRSLVRKQDLASVMRLDEVSRSVYGYSGLDRPEWFALTAGDVRRIAALPDPSALVGVASFHPSGYVREAAVAALDTLPGDEVLPYLLLRLNDWVTPVADAAKQAVMRRAEESATAWIRCVPIVSRLGGATRREHSDVIDVVFAMLRRPANRVALEAGFDAPDRATRLVSYRLAREATTGGDLAGVVARSLTDPDPSIRFTSFRDGVARLRGEALAGVLALAERDSFAPIRRMALEVAVEAFPDTALTCARSALLDHSASVRQVARFVVGEQDSSFSIADFYRDLLGTPDAARLVVALAGITEAGIEQDAALVAPFLTHARSGVRAQAVRSLGKLDPIAYANVFVTALSDASPRVVRAARDVLEEQPAFIDYATIKSIMQYGPYAHSRADALRLGDTLGKWPSILLWLEASQDGEPALVEAARERIDQWIARANFRYTAPRPGEVSSIQALLDRSEGSLNATVVTNIRGFLQPWLDASTK